MKLVFATFMFEAVHKYPNAPSQVAYLREPHRHLFHVKVEWQVDHNERQIEFITAQADARSVVAALLYGSETILWSCERWAEEILNRVNAYRVTVSEDGENGATVEI